MNEAQEIGILAYGSLISDPGAELREVHVRTIEDVLTPFCVEFARKSAKRGDAPTLVPFDNGLPVRAQVFVLETLVDDAADRLYRRETDQIGSAKRYKHSDNPGPNKVVVKRLRRFVDLNTVLYTQIGANIADLCAEQLALLAIASVAKATQGKDGISYLIDMMEHGIETPLSTAYAEEIKHITGTRGLAEALTKIRTEAKSG